MNTYLDEVIDEWCPTYPRRVTSRQLWADSKDEVLRHIKNAESDGDLSPFVSVYGFPRGHTSDGEIPTVDTIFIDFDIPAGGEYRSSHPDLSAWKRDMSGLLTRVRVVTRVLAEHDSGIHFRAALSGHKGVHLYLDFHPIDPTEGTLGQFKVGTKEYADELIEWIERFTKLDLESWVDVDSSDMGRLCRVPNTLHEGATAAFNEDRYCVPVSIRELSQITPDEYIRLTRERRPLPEDCRRTPSENATSIITQYIRSASATNRNTNTPSAKDYTRIADYKKHANENIELSDIPFLVSNKPCIMAFRDRADMFNHGNQSHVMELNVIAHLVNNSVPIDVIIEFFEHSDDFDRNVTLHQVYEVISRSYHSFSCEKIWRDAPEFCLREACNIYNYADDAEKPRTAY